jgi:hypothetical protein
MLYALSFKTLISRRIHRKRTVLSDPWLGGWPALCVR